MPASHVSTIEAIWSVAAGKRLLRNLLQARRRYRSDELIKVWSVTVDRSEDAFALADVKDAEVEEIWMSGCEFGKLLVSEEL